MEALEVYQHAFEPSSAHGLSTPPGQLGSTFPASPHPLCTARTMSAEQLPARIDLLKAAFGDAASKFEENLNEGALVQLHLEELWQEMAAVEGCEGC